MSIYLRLFGRCRLRLHRWCPGHWTDWDTPAGLALPTIDCSCRCHQ